MVTIQYTHSSLYTQQIFDTIYAYMLQIYKAICNNCIHLWKTEWKIFLCMCGYIHGNRHMSTATGWYYAFCKYHMIPVCPPACFTPYLNLTFHCTLVPGNFIHSLYSLQFMPHCLNEFCKMSSLKFIVSPFLNTDKGGSACYKYYPF